MNLAIAETGVKIMRTAYQLQQMKESGVMAEDLFYNAKFKVAAAAAIVYQQCGIDMEKITFAMDNVIGDLSGLICDGAKPGCAMKTVTAVDTAMRSGFMAIAGYGLSDDDGIIGTTPENSIKNLGRIALEGMFKVDPTVIHILQDKAASHGRA